jgi:N-acetylglucosaminyldiphosphoundecaprenol N-acetyl-beta-D-mannosaminyltransferase
MGRQPSPEQPVTAPSVNAGPSPVASINLLGVRVSALNLDLAVQEIRRDIAEGRPGYVCISGAHALVDCQSDPELKEVLNGARLVTPDGMPLVWELRRRGHAAAGRVYGPDLMLALFGHGMRHYLYGATDRTLDLLQTRLSERFPKAEIVGRHAPPFRPLTDEEETEVVRKINASGADIVWVGIGAPKQERWMARMRDRLDPPMLIGVGAAFDFHAGLQPQAPSWMQQRGLEWAFRLSAEPRRLWRRYLRVVPGYMALLALQRSGLRRFPMDADLPK